MYKNYIFKGLYHEDHQLQSSVHLNLSYLKAYLRKAYLGFITEDKSQPGNKL